MKKLIELLKKNKMTLIVSLPENSLELALAAVEGGADALKVHCGIKHQASGVEFGTLDEEKGKLLAIIHGVNIPVGLVPGFESPPSEKEMDEIIEMGFDYFDMYVDKMPEYMFKQKDITKIGAVNGKYPVDEAISLPSKGLDAIEASIIPHLGYGQSLTIGDLQVYITLATALSVPIIVPTQRKITPEELPILSDTGIKSIMIGAIVTGKTPDSILKATREFRTAIDSLETN